MVKNKIKKALSAALSGALAFSFCLGGFPSFHIDNTAFAKEKTVESGSYVTSIERGFLNKEKEEALDLKVSFTQAYPHFFPQAKVEIDSTTKKQYVTIAVENWNLYEAFVPLKQSYNSYFYGDNDSKYNDFDNSVIPSNFTNFSVTNISNYTTTDEVNEYFDWGTSDSKYGNISLNYDNDTQVCYVSFEIEDYKQPIGIYAWTSVSNSLAGTPEEYALPLVFYLDTDNMTNLEDIDKAVADDSVLVEAKHSTAAVSKLTYWNYTNYDPGTQITALFDECTVSKSDEGIIAICHISDEYVDSFTAYKTLKNPNNETASPRWNPLKNGDFVLSVVKNGYVTLDFSKNDLIFGKRMYFDTQKSSRYGFAYLCLTDNPVKKIQVTDEETGITVIGNSSVLDEGIQLDVAVNEPFYYEGEDISEGYRSVAYKNPKWYTVTLKDSDGNVFTPNGTLSISIPIPEDFSTDKYYTEISNEDGSLNGSSMEYNLENHCMVLKNESQLNGKTFAIMEKVPFDNVYEIKESGIYKASAFLFKSSSENTFSMANGALNNEVYIVVDDNSKKMYFKAKAMNVLSEDRYLGNICCNNYNVAGEAYEKSVSFTDFLTDDNGSLINNEKYNAINEWACVKGGILTLENDSYINEKNAYSLAIASPAMATINDLNYEDIPVDNLTALLKVQGLEKCDAGVTLDTILNEGYGYQPSALLRRIKQVETKFGANKGEAKLEAALAEANDVYTAEYADAAAASKAYEAAIAKLDEFEAGYDMTKNLPDGKYIVTANMVQLDQVTASMSDAAINHEVVVNVKDGKASLQVEFKGLAFSGKFGYLSRLWNYDKGYTYSLSGAPSGTMTEAKVLSRYDVIDEYSNDYPPHYLEFELVDGVGAEWVPLHVYVPVMTGSEDQDVNMHIDWSTARKAGEIAEYEGNSLSLKDDFGLNFFFTFGEQTLNDAGAKVQFTLPDGSVKEYVISEIADDDKTENGYRFSANVAAKEMTAPVKAQIILSNGETSDEFTCSVKEYADKLLAFSTNESEIKLVKSILNYGGYAQEYFGYNESALANADIDNALGEVTIAGTKQEKVDDEDDGINFYGSSLVLNTKIDLRAYFTLEAGAEISDYTFMFGDTELTPVKSGNKYYVAIPEITSKNIDQRSAIDVTNKSGEGELSVKTGPYAYIYKALTKSSNEKLQNLAKALYFYSQAAENYSA